MPDLPSTADLLPRARTVTWFRDRNAGGLLVLLALGAALLFFDAGARVLASNDEARFPMLARDMLRHGSWLVPRLGDVPYLNKPPVDAWLIALAAWPTGAVTQATAVWPSLLAALGVALATWWIGARLWDRAVGLAAGFVVLTTHGVFSMARVPMPDMVLCLALTGAMAAFVAARFGERAGAMTVCYALLGVGFLVKGPAALLGLAIVGAYVLARGGGSRLRRLRLVRAALVITPVVAPWWIIALASRGPQFVQDNVVTDWLEWYRPFSHPSLHTLVAPFEQAAEILLPWSPLVLIALVAAVRAARHAPADDLAFVLVWAGVVFVIIALSEQQRMRYYLPLCPPAALLVAVWYRRLFAPKRAALGVGVGLATAAAVAIALVTWQRADNTRHNALLDLGALRASTAQEARQPIYALGVPELPLAFYLDRPVVPVRGVDAGSPLAPGYVVVDDRSLARWPSGCASDPIAAGAVNGRRFSVLRLAPPGCAGS